MIKIRLGVADMNVIATIGHNHPPVTPFDEIKARIEDLYEEAKQWLDGEPVTTQDQANALNTLENRIREVAKEAEALRKGEVKPLDDAKAEIQERFNALIGETKAITGKTVMAIAAIKSALKPYLLELDRIQREAAAKAREEAEKAERAALVAMQTREADNLAQREEAERLVSEAKALNAAASKAEDAKAHAKGDGRAAGLRSVWVAKMNSPFDAAAWAWKVHRDELTVFVQGLADRDVRAGARVISGFNIIEDRVL